MLLPRNLVVAASASYELRTEKYQGRDHLVVPVVALVHGVVHAMNASAPELVTAEEFSRKPGGWNGRPLFLGHPSRNGRPVSGNDPGVLESDCIGIVFNAGIRKNKLTMEAWIDVARAETIAPELLTRVRALRAIEISVGVFVDTDETTGEFEGRTYRGAWHNIVPDHLALLPTGDEGACSVEMGCGVRAAANPEGHNQYTNKGAAEASTKADTASTHANNRDMIPNQDRADRHSEAAVAHGKAADAHASAATKAKTATTKDYHNQMAAGHRSKADSHAMAAGIYAGIKDAKGRVMADKKNAGFLRRMLDVFRGSQSADEMSSDDLKRRLYEALKDVEPHLSYVENYHPVTEPTYVVYSVWIPSMATGPEIGMGYQSIMYERAFELADDGVVTLNSERTEVEPVMRYEPVPGAEPTAAAATPTEPAPKDAAAGAPCSCHENAPATTPSNKETDMTKTERVKALIAKAKHIFTEADQAFLEAASDDQLARFEAAPEATVATPVTPVVEPKAAAAAPVAEAPKAAATFEELLATADPATRDAIATGKRLGEEKKAATISALKATGRCKMTDAELGAKSQADLDVLVELAGSNVRAAIDFGGAGAPKDLAANKNDAPEPPSLDEALKADRAKK